MSAHLNDLSTTTLIAALLHEPVWNTQLELASMIESRLDSYNVLPLCEFLVEPQQNRSVQRAVARCVSKHGFAQALRWMESCILGPGSDTRRKLLAIRAIADFGRPVETAKRAVSAWVDQAGGAQAAVSQLLNYAVEAVGHGDNDTAELAIDTALQIAESHPGAQGLIYRELRSRLAA